MDRRSTERGPAVVTLRFVLRVPAEIHDVMVAHCLSGMPDEACGLLSAAPGQSEIGHCYPTRNAAASARVYTVDPRDHLRADRDAEARGEEIVAVFHSHTHTDAYPSPTDVAQAPDPGWHYVVVSLRDTHPVVRSYRIAGDEVNEESMILVPRHLSVASASQSRDPLAATA